MSDYTLRVRLDPDDFDELCCIARDMGLTLSSVARLMIQNAIIEFIVVRCKEDLYGSD